MIPRRILRADKDPHSVQDVLAQITNQMGIGHPNTISRLFGRWSDLVGEDMAAHVVPLQIRAETLYVEVPDQSWALQIRYLESQLIAMIADELGPNKVERLSVRVKSHRLD